MSDKKFEDIAGWYLVANVRENQPFGKNHEIRKGTKHFTPNTKVYCSYPQWGDGYENIIVDVDIVALQNLFAWLFTGQN